MGKRPGNRSHNLFASTFCGVEVRQYWADLALWELFLNEYQDIRTIIELGAFSGGLTLFLKAQCVARNLQFRSMDRNYPVALDTPLASELGLISDFVQNDFWTSEILPYWLADRWYKPVLLFVDGGNKAKEFAGFVPMLASGDYVGVHDYGTEFQPGHIAPVQHLIEPEFEDECKGPPTPCLTRFWRIK